MSFSKTKGKITGEIDGQQASAQESYSVKELSPGHFILTSGTEIHEIFVTDRGLLSDGNGIDGVEVSILSEREQIINEHFSKTRSAGGSASTKGIILSAPMPGMVRSVSVKVGDKVEKNTQVLVLEAMKMENSIAAGFTGVVSKIHVEAGISVEKGVPLVEFSN